VDKVGGIGDPERVHRGDEEVVDEQKAESGGHQRGAQTAGKTKDGDNAEVQVHVVLRVARVGGEKNAGESARAGDDGRQGGEPAEPAKSTVHSSVVPAAVTACRCRGPAT